MSIKNGTKKRDQLYRRQNGLCCYCRKRVTKSKATIEHVVPRCAGGSNRMENLAMACHKCNHKKSKVDQNYKRIRVEDSLTLRVVRSSSYDFLGVVYAALEATK